MSGLSAEAEVFIPRGVSPQSEGQMNIQQIPSYMTNCYPFVQTEYRMPWVSNSRPLRHGYHGFHGNRKHRMSGGNHGNRMPGGPGKYMEQSNPFMFHGVPPPLEMGWNNPVSYNPNLPATSMEYPGALPNGMPFDGGTCESQNSRQNHRDATAGKRQQKKDNSSQKKNSNDKKERKVSEKEDTVISEQKLDGKKKGERNKQQQRDRQNNMMVASKKVQGSSALREERVPRGIIFKEISIQTEFPERFANKTLAVYPCPFYSPQNHNGCRLLYSSDSELDSDSGYSSPLHKRNYVSSGTHPAEFTETVVFTQHSESVQSISNANQSEKRQNISKSSQSGNSISNSDKLGQNKLNLLHPEQRPYNQNSVQSGQSDVVTPSAVPQQKLSYAMIAQKVPSPKSSVQPENTPSANVCDISNDCKNSNNVSGEITHSAKKSVNISSKPIENAGDNKNMDNVEDNETTTGEKKKRKRNRKRSKRKKFEDSSNQRTTEDVELHFEDEEEFPDLLGSVRSPSQDRYSSVGREKISSTRETTPPKENHFFDHDNVYLDSLQKNERTTHVLPSDNGSVSDSGETSANKTPNYSNPSPVVMATPVNVSGPPSYSSILKAKKPVVTFDERQLQQNEKLIKESKTKAVTDSAEVRVNRKRRKRREMMNQAAEEELAEIGLEQDMLRELNLKPATAKKLAQKGPQKGATSVKEPPASQAGILNVTPQQPTPSGKKSKQTIALDLGAMIDALEKKKDVPVQKKETQPSVDKAKKNTDTQKGVRPHNMLDASAPMLKRGKERENPKPKKPSPLKKVILKEREEKKKLRLLDDSVPGNSGVPVGIGVISAESDLSQDAYSFKGSADYGGVTPASNDLSPISQTSPISMSPLSPGASPLSSEVNSPIAGTIGKEAVLKIHSRRFREYCNQVLNKDIDNCCTTLLQDLVRFQDRVYHKEPNKAKSKRRFVLGLREVTKHLKLKKIKCVIISPNLEKIQSKGGLDDALNNILNLCNQQNVPFVFALGRRSLGRACAKLVPVSVVGIFNYDGTDDNFKGLMDLTAEARQAYKEMVSVIEKEIREYPTRGAAASAPHIYAHMGHSRTPSGASVLSFTSSILSEPISENYPHSEPETDSKGYEIIKDSPDLDQYFSSTSAIQNEGIQYNIQAKVKDIDDGNEADTEDYGDLPRVRVQSGISADIDKDSDNDSEQGSRDTVEELPHIDSIHSSTYDLSTEILSQHSGRTIENCEAMSTHSSRTLGDGSSTILADPGERSKHDTPKSTESPSSTLQRGKVIDEERIQNWVDETQSRLENLQLQCSTEDSDNTDSESETEENSVNENEKDDSYTVEVKG
ncbi:uncharacterized protein LOC132559585 [Ylistrum balloti]|uniref:uncharacterized protein LOC132559585 n=1 Tax=Ylistrum balloti TaxID=509963 RepID=UPI0029058A6B|nr:uncharacterized protein LOC132559585 [Ylistrum balloti]